MGTTANIGINQGLATLPYAAATKRTKVINISSAFGCTQGFAVGLVATAMFYADSSGNWRMEFNVDGTLSSAATSSTVTITGVVFKSGLNQAISLFAGGIPYTGTASTTDNTNQIYCQFTNSGTVFRASGNVALNTEPTTYTTSNMETSPAVDVYIPEASASVTGLVTAAAQSFGGAKTFTDTATGTKIAKFTSDSAGASATEQGLLSREFKYSSAYTLTYPGGGRNGNSFASGSAYITRVGTGYFIYIQGSMDIAAANSRTTYVLSNTSFTWPAGTPTLSSLRVGGGMTTPDSQLFPVGVTVTTSASSLGATFDFIFPAGSATGNGTFGVSLYMPVI
jgi:hypothetical protein